MILDGEYIPYDLLAMGVIGMGFLLTLVPVLIVVFIKGLLDYNKGEGDVVRTPPMNHHGGAGLWNDD